MKIILNSMLAGEFLLLCMTTEEETQCLQPAHVMIVRRDINLTDSHRDIFNKYHCKNIDIPLFLLAWI